MMSPTVSLSQAFLLSLFSFPMINAAANLNARLNNGLAITPPMGWNSYNHYSCAPNQSIVHSNAQALVDLGLKARGYHFVTVDCGWTLPNRTANGTIQWNTARFPDEGFGLGKFIHSMGLGFGVYSDAGIKMCMTGEPDQVGSLYHEQQDAQKFASWGVDLLKYDNCWSEAAHGFPNVDYSPVESPSGRYTNMTNALASVGRPILFQICEWGVDFPSAWAPALGNSWRVTNDIIPAYRTIPRILNQVVPQTDFAGPGHWLDLDMLEIGNNVFTSAEEQTHFSLWAILKSPLVIGAALKDTMTSISQASLNVLLNEEVISYNQDSLGVSASFRRRWTAEGYEVWAGPLSGNRTVVALINLKNVARQLTLDFPDVGIQKAGSVKDIWNNITRKDVLTSYTAQVAAHGTMLLELGSTTAAGSYSPVDARTSGQTNIFSQVYGATRSNNYSLTLHFTSAMQSDSTILINNKTYSLPSSSSSLTIPFSLNAGNNNTITINSPTPPTLPTGLTIIPPPSTFYPSTAFASIGSSTLTTCSTNLCLPVGSKVGNLSPTGSASLNITSPPSSLPGPKFVSIYFCNNDIAISTSWGTGTNTRNLTVAVNGQTTRLEVPLSGRSSELFSPDHGWEDSGLFRTVIEGWKEGGGSNEVVVGNEGGGQGLVSFGADFVGLDVLW